MVFYFAFKCDSNHAFYLSLKKSFIHWFLTGIAQVTSEKNQM